MKEGLAHPSQRSAASLTALVLISAAQRQPSPAVMLERPHHPRLGVVQADGIAVPLWRRQWQRIQVARAEPARVPWVEAWLEGLELR